MYDGHLKNIHKSNAENTLMFSDVVAQFEASVAPVEGVPQLV